MMNKISPGSVAKFKQSGPAFLLMENVQAFLAAIKKYGVPDEEVFQTPDLFEARNIPQVTLCLYALARTTQKHPEYNGPKMGPKMATENKRNFSEEQIRQGRDGQVGLQVLFTSLTHASLRIKMYIIISFRLVLTKVLLKLEQVAWVTPVICKSLCSFLLKNISSVACKFWTSLLL